MRPMKIKSAFMGLTVLAAGLLAGRSALAGPKDFAVYVPGMGASAEQAKPYLDAFLRLIEKEAGWPANSATGLYVDDPRDMEVYLEKTKPGFALMAPSLYYQLACRKTPM